MIDTYKSQNVNSDIWWPHDINSITQGAQCGNNYMYVIFQDIWKVMEIPPREWHIYDIKPVY